MPLPVGLSTFTLRSRPHWDASGALAFVGMVGKLRPSRELRLAADGTLVQLPVDVTVAADGTITVPGLPHTDQFGGFTYSLRWPVPLGAPSPGDLPRFAVPASAGVTVFVEDLVESPVVPGVAVPIMVGPQGPAGPTGPQGPAGSVFDSTLTQIYNTTLTSQPATGQPVVALASVANLQPGWTVMLGSDVNTAERRTVASISGLDVTLTANVTGTHPTTGQVSYSNEPIDSDYLSVATYQQVTGGKDFRGLVRFERPVPADTNLTGYDALDLVNVVLRSRAAGASGGGIVAKAAGDMTGGVIDWIHAGTLTNNSGYLFHLTHAVGTGKGGLIGLGVQGDGGLGLLIAKDGPKGIGLYIDQKGVVNDPAAFGVFISQASRYADALRFQQVQPGTAPLFKLNTSGHTPWPGQTLSEWQGITPQSVFGYVEALTGQLVWQQPIVADANKANLAAALKYKGRIIGAMASGQVVIDDRWPHAGGATDGGGAVRLFAGSTQPYSGQLRMSLRAQALHLDVADGAARPGAENVRTVFEAHATATRTIGVDQQSVPLITPTGVTVTVGGTAGSTTYGYRVAAVNSKGTTIASATVTTATGPATLTATDRVTVSWAHVPGAASYRVYGRTSGSELLMGTVGVPTRTVTDGKVYAATTRTVTDVATTAHSNTITSATAAFTADDVGRRVQIPGQGYLGFELDTTITSVTNATTAVLAYSPIETGTGRTATISAPALTLLDSVTAAFSITDIGNAVQVAGAGAGGAIHYAVIDQYISATRVVLSAAPALTVSGASVTITGGTVPLSFVDNGTVTPSGALPGNPAGQTARVTPWVNQTADVAQWQDNAATPATAARINRNGRLMLRPPQTAPALGDMVDGELAFSTDASGNLVIHARVAGALKTATVALA